jgi:hypothetical protein
MAGEQYLGKDAKTVSKCITQLEDVKSSLSSPNTLIFIAHYGNGIDNIIMALDFLGIKNPIYATSTLSVDDWRDKIDNILPKYDWTTCVPDYHDGDYNDVIKDFVTFSLQRTVYSIIACKSDPSKSFDEAWRNTKIPDNLDLTFDSEDIVVPMKCADKSKF